MFGLKVTINDDCCVVAAAEDAGQVTAMLTATGVLGHATRPNWNGEVHECWLSVRGSSRRESAADDRWLWIRRYGLSIGDQVTIEVVDTSESTPPLAKHLGDRRRAVAVRQMFGYTVAVNDAAPVTGAAEDLYVLTAIVGASGVLDRNAKPARPDQTQDFRLSLAGLTSRRGGCGDEHLHWLERDDLVVGDRIVIKIVETESPSVPANRSSAE